MKSFNTQIDQDLRPRFLPWIVFRRQTRSVLMPFLYGLLFLLRTYPVANRSGARFRTAVILKVGKIWNSSLHFSVPGRPDSRARFAQSINLAVEAGEDRFFHTTIPIPPATAATKILTRP